MYKRVGTVMRLSLIVNDYANFVVIYFVTLVFFRIFAKYY